MKMNQIIVLFVTAALVSNTCLAALIKNKVKMMPGTNKKIENNVLPSKHLRKFISIISAPPPLNPHLPGTIVQLTCEVMGSPAPVIHWYKNDAPVFEYDVESNEIIDTNPTSMARLSSTLLVTKTDKQDLYTCLAVSRSNTVKAEAIVYSTSSQSDHSERGRLAPLAPRLLVTYKMYLDTIGSDVVLPCRARGHPKPKISWGWRNNTEYVPLESHPRMKVLRSGELMIKNLRWSDMGEFVCRATNAFGSQTAVTFVYPAKAG